MNTRGRSARRVVIVTAVFLAGTTLSGTVATTPSVAASDNADLSLSLVVAGDDTDSFEAPSFGMLSLFDIAMSTAKLQALGAGPKRSYDGDGRTVFTDVDARGNAIVIAGTSDGVSTYPAEYPSRERLPDGAQVPLNEKLYACFTLDRDTNVEFRIAYEGCSISSSCSLIHYGPYDAPGLCREYTPHLPEGLREMRLRTYDTGGTLEIADSSFYVYDPNVPSPTPTTPTPTPTNSAVTFTPTRTRTPTAVTSTATAVATATPTTPPSYVAALLPYLANQDTLIMPTPTATATPVVCALMEREPNNSPGEALGNPVLCPGQAIRGLLPPSTAPDPGDYYTLLLGDSQEVSIVLDPTTIREDVEYDLGLWACPPSGCVQVGYSGRVGRSIDEILTELMPGTYFVDVRPRTDVRSEDPYSLTLEFVR